MAEELVEVASQETEKPQEMAWSSRPPRSVLGSALSETEPLARAAASLDRERSLDACPRAPTPPSDQAQSACYGTEQGIIFPLPATTLMGWLSSL